MSLAVASAAIVVAAGAWVVWDSVSLSSSPRAASSVVDAPVPNESSKQPPRVEPIGASSDGAIADGAATSEEQPQTPGPRFAWRLRRLSDSWPSSTDDQTVAEVSALLDDIFLAASDVQELDTIARVLLEAAPLGGASAAQSPGAASAVRAEILRRSFIARILSEPELEPRLRRRIETELSSESVPAPTARWREALLASLQQVGAELTREAPDSPEAWAAWIACRNAILDARSPERDRVTIRPLDALIRGVRGGLSARQREAIALLAAAMSWQPAGWVRDITLSWFAPGAASAEVLGILTRAIVSSAAPGIDSTLVAEGDSVNASRIRALLEKAWNAPVLSRDPELLSRLRSAAREALAAPEATGAASLATALRCARLSRAADLLRAGRVDEASPLIKTNGPELPGPRQADPLPSPDPDSPALRYAALGAAAPARVAWMESLLDNAMTLDALAASVVIREASRGTPVTVRDAARSVVRRRVGDLSLLLAALDQVLLLPETPENAAWIASLAGRRLRSDPSGRWRSDAHLALLEATSARLADSGSEAWIESIAAQLAALWLDAASESAPPDGVDPAIAASLLEASLRRRIVESQGASILLDAIDRRRDARLQLVRSGVHVVAVRRAAAVELAALALSQERSDLAPRGRAIVDDFAARWATSPDVLVQITEAERAALRLSLLMLDEPETSP